MTPLPMSTRRAAATRLSLFFALGLAGPSLGCGGGEGTPSGATGSVQVFAEAEASIPEGIDAGGGDENIQDGWSVRYDRFLVLLGRVHASRSDADEVLADERTFLLDLKRVPAGGYTLVTFDDAAAARWDRFGFDLPNAKGGEEIVAPATSADLALLQAGGFSVYFEGSIERSTGDGCTDAAPCKKTFKWGLPAGTSFDDCSSEEGVPGFAVPEGGTAQVKPTIHGDHWFFSNLTAGAEITKRYAQYIADADLDGDGETTLDELKQTKAADVFPPSKYNLSGALGGPVTTAYDYVLAQARTLGDFQGDGECPTRKLLP